MKLPYFVVLISLCFLCFYKIHSSTLDKTDSKNSNHSASLLILETPKTKLSKTKIYETRCDTTLSHIEFPGNLTPDTHTNDKSHHLSTQNKAPIPIGFDITIPWMKPSITAHITTNDYDAFSDFNGNPVVDEQHTVFIEQPGRERYSFSVRMNDCPTNHYTVQVERLSKDSVKRLASLKINQENVEKITYNQNASTVAWANHRDKEMTITFLHKPKNTTQWQTDKLDLTNLTLLKNNSTLGSPALDDHAQKLFVPFISELEQQTSAIILFYEHTHSGWQLVSEIVLPLNSNQTNQSPTVSYTDQTLTLVVGTEWFSFEWDDISEQWLEIQFKPHNDENHTFTFKKMYSNGEYLLSTHSQPSTHVAGQGLLSSLKLFKKQYNHEGAFWSQQPSLKFPTAIDPTHTTIDTLIFTPQWLLIKPSTYDYTQNRQHPLYLFKLNPDNQQWTWHKTLKLNQPAEQIALQEHQLIIKHATSMSFYSWHASKEDWVYDTAPAILNKIKKIQQLELTPQGQLLVSHSAGVDIYQ